MVNFKAYLAESNGLDFIFGSCVALAFWSQSSWADRDWLRESSGALQQHPVWASVDISFESRFKMVKVLHGGKAEEGITRRIYFSFLGALSKVEVISGANPHAEN